MANNTNSSAQNILSSILAVANAEQDLSYPPFIFEAHINVATSILLSKCIKEFVSNPVIQDIIEPFEKSEKLPVKFGYVELPDDFRDILGNPATNVRPDGKDCQSDQPVITDAEFEVDNLKGGCRTVPLYPVPISEWDDLTTSSYDFPTLHNAICCYFGGRKLKVCPYDISKVELRYARNENRISLPYIMQPDDTFLLDTTNPLYKDSEWTGAAFKPLFSMVMALYSAYSRDPDLKDWSSILNTMQIL